jgi:hypothetical protein
MHVSAEFSDLAGISNSVSTPFAPSRDYSTLTSLNLAPSLMLRATSPLQLMLA